MGVLGAIVQVLRPAMGHRRHHHAVGGPVAGELVGHQHPRHVPQALEQSAEELLGGLGIPARLDQDVEYVAVLVDRAPQVVDFAVDPDEDLVEVPFVAGAGAPTAQLIGVGLPKLGTPAPDVS